ncbi:uncharacterized protein EV420DRAFT_425513 [Desarmillaria tabescens]|uniref:Uncharacterized protein n=1 Tax=Armillaria tabescens TaxID=1929756 RepID=A0AA39NL96_ARMTA|nr:uncharacterized protein EV420DRAFT_425513 [Desarmillaria tabescens]KAK0467733.1 hypothetical protein EV420DRAFT_425513 [Desarmillaria tabescens]
MSSLQEAPKTGQVPVLFGTLSRTWLQREHHNSFEFPRTMLYTKMLRPHLAKTGTGIRDFAHRIYLITWSPSLRKSFDDYRENIARTIKGNKKPKKVKRFRCEYTTVLPL